MSHLERFLKGLRAEIMHCPTRKVPSRSRPSSQSICQLESRQIAKKEGRAKDERPFIGSYTSPILVFQRCQSRWTCYSTNKLVIINANVGPDKIDRLAAAGKHIGGCISVALPLNQLING